MWLSSEIFAESTSKLRRTKKYTDARIRLDDGTSHCIHKCLFARDSEFFRKMFKYGVKFEYHVSNVSVGTFEKIMDWIYEHRLNLSTDDCLEVLQAADYLSLQELVDVVTQFLKTKINPKNVHAITNLCSLYNNQNLLNWCIW